jgi:hypothetical protein
MEGRFNALLAIAALRIGLNLDERWFLSKKCRAQGYKKEEK